MLEQQNEGEVLCSPSLLQEYMDEITAEMITIGQVRLHNILSKYVEYGDYALENDDAFLVVIMQRYLIDMQKKLDKV